jgi:1,4-dihydroxy-2-naphthoate octaprenyltransferase
MMNIQQLLDLIRLARPLFLVGGFVFHGLGVAIAFYQGVPLHLPILLWGQLAITTSQLMTHFSNDYFDLAADKANLTPTAWSGGSRVLAEGRLPASVALVAAIVCALIALTAVFILTFFLPTGPLTLPLFLLALFLAWEYSAPPLRLHSRGLGAVTVALIVPILTPLVGYYLQVGHLTWLPLLAAWPLACLQAAMIFIINFPDAAADEQVGKRTLVVRLGGVRAARVYLGLLALAYGSLPLLVVLGLPAVVTGAACLPLPIAVWLAWRMWQGAWREPSAWSSLGFGSVALLMATAVVETAVFVAAWD